MKVESKKRAGIDIYQPENNIVSLHLSYEI